jgi:YfiH family protein
MTPAVPDIAASRRQADLDVLTWRAFDGLAVDALVTTRRGGVSTGPYASLNLGLHVGDDAAHVVENRRRAAAALGADLSDLVFCNQVHGTEVAVVGDEHRGQGALAQDDGLVCDGLVTTTPGVGLVVKAADCVPLVLYDPAAHVLACVHAGWRGTTARVADAAVERMRSLGAAPESVVVGIGPAVPAERYQVGLDVLDAARDCFAGDVDGLVRPDGSGRWTFDLRAANRRILVEAGVRAQNIEVAPVGTGAGTPFFSDRAARPCGRFAAIARLRPRDAA